MILSHDNIRGIEWRGDELRLLDQRFLPETETYFTAKNVADVQRAIVDMVVRGAPAIGITTAYGVVLAAKARFRETPSGWQELLKKDLDQLAAARPTAVNLAWALERMKVCLEQVNGDPGSIALAEAQAIHQEDIAANQHMGELGAALLGADCGILTHCNTGSLATGGYGTALGVIRNAWASGQVRDVIADETRPWLQGSRLTAWELVKDGIPVTLIADGAAAHLMAVDQVDWVIVGADRIAANGDVANKIGTYGLAVTARHHGVRFMVVAPLSSVDFDTRRGTDIRLE
ncbi:MAG: S-methyl-5-thioribose-1-phosphate isomerase, partial [Gammaproteobacteria bacterium]